MTLGTSVPRTIRYMTQRSSSASLCGPLKSWEKFHVREQRFETKLGCEFPRWRVFALCQRGGVESSVNYYRRISYTVMCVRYMYFSVELRVRHRSETTKYPWFVLFERQLAIVAVGIRKLFASQTRKRADAQIFPRVCWLPFEGAFGHFLCGQLGVRKANF